MFQYASVLNVKPELHFVIVVYHLAFNVNKTLNAFIYSGDWEGALQITCKSKIIIDIKSLLAPIITTPNKHTAGVISRWRPFDAINIKST